MRLPAAVLSIYLSLAANGIAFADASSPSPEATIAPIALPGGFQMPATWKSLPLTPLQPRALVAVWLSPIAAHDGFRQNVNILKVDDLGYSLIDYDQVSQTALVKSGAKLSSDVPNHACPGGTSRIITHGEKSNGFDLAIVQVLTKDGKSMYVVTYSRLATDPPDTATMAEVGAFCPSPAADAAPALTPAPVPSAT